MVFQYLAALLNKAAKGSVLLTDRLTVLIVPFSALAIWAIGAETAESLQETLLIGVAATVATVVILRLAMAGYLLWKEDDAEKRRLTRMYEAEKTRPERLEREAAHAHATALRTELGDRLARACALADMIGRAPTEASRLLGEVDLAIGKDALRLRELITALSYDVPLRICAHEMHLLTARIVAQQSDTMKEDIEKLDKLKKVVFRLIHKKYNNESSEILSMVEARIIVGRSPEGSSFIDDLHRAMLDPAIKSELLKYVDSEEYPASPSEAFTDLIGGQPAQMLRKGN